MSESTARHTHELTLSILRNPYGRSAEEVKSARLDAADRIDALTAQIAELREALETLEQLATYYSMPNTTLLNAALEKARAALAKGGE